MVTGKGNEDIFSVKWWNVRVPVSFESSFLIIHYYVDLFTTVYYVIMMTLPSVSMLLGYE